MLTTRSLAAFLALTFALAWGILALFLFAREPMTALFGPISGSHPLFILATYSPAVAAIIVVLRTSGIDGLTRFLSRLLMWRCPFACYVFLLAGIPLIFIAGAVVKGNLLEQTSLLPGFGSMLSAMAFMIVLGPVEEIGWRGVALPLLQRHMAPLYAGLVLGMIWGVWHLPAFFLSGTPQSAWGFTPFLVGSVAVSVILTPLFNASHGSILLAALFHFQLNNPLFPDAQPYDIPFFVAAAVVTTMLNWQAMIRSEASVTLVVPARNGDLGQHRVAPSLPSGQ